MASTNAIETKTMWSPDPSKATIMDHFRARVNEKFCLNLEKYVDLCDWSCENYSDFWEEFFHFSGLIYSQRYDQVIDTKKNISEIPEWFRGCRMNYAENLLEQKDGDRTALYATGEGRQLRKKSFSELRATVARYAASMRKMGITKGDRVVGYIPNSFEAIEAMLAAASIGAVWSSTSPDFGTSGVLDRFTQIQPKLIFSVDAVIYNGKTHSHIEKIAKVVEGLPDLQKVVIIQYTNADKLDLSEIKNSCYLEEFLSLGEEKGTTPNLVYEQLPFNHPLYIMYSSGTTGIPKCMVHSAGGTLLQHLKEHMLHGNMTKNDILLYYTTTGWMMWNWMVSALAVGASVVLFDGSPLVPNANVLWDLIDDVGITVLGTGAKWLAVLEEKGVKPRQSHNLSTLHSILSTGSPLKPQSYDYVYRDVKEDLLLGSITGGTDLISCFAGQNWTVPVYRGEIQSRNLGMAIEAWDEGGNSVVGESGELICTKPFPCMPTHFWNDSDGAKYRKAYFSKFPGVWSHGDYCLINPETRGIWMLGRSDGTLNPSGVRFGSAEIYNIVECFKEVQDSLCVGQLSKDRSEERVILFLKMVAGCQLTDEVVKRIKTTIRSELSARHVPTMILETTDIPYTQNGKKVEVAVKRVLSGEKVTHRGAFANPDSLDIYTAYEQLQGF